MSALRWAAVPVVAGMLTGNVAAAAAQEPAPAPTPPPAATPDPTLPAVPDPTLPPTPEPEPIPPVTGSVVYLTTITTTTTNVNAPITVIAAPVTTTLNTSMTSPGTGAGSTDGPRDPSQARERFVIDLTGCRQPGRRSTAGPDTRVNYARVQLAPDAVLVVRVNRKRIATLRLPATAQRRALRLRLAPDGMLAIDRPSGRVLAVQGCTPA